MPAEYRLQRAGGWYGPAGLQHQKGAQKDNTENTERLEASSTYRTAVALCSECKLSGVRATDERLLITPGFPGAGLPPQGEEGEIRVLQGSIIKLWTWEMIALMSMGC